MDTILTNIASLSALQNLAVTQSSLAKTQDQVSSGLKVATAADSAAYWSIATTLRSDTGALSAVSDALNLGSAVLGAAAAAVDSAIALVGRVKADLVTAQQPGVSAAQVQTDIAAQQRSLVAVLGSASFDGVNLLDGSTGSTAQFVTSFVRGPSGATSVGTAALSTAGGITVSGSGYTPNGVQLVGPGGLLSTGYLAIPQLQVSSAAYGRPGTGPGAGTYQAASFLSFDISSAPLSDIQGIAQAIDLLQPALLAAGTQIGAVQSTVANQQNYVSALSDALASGTGSLVDADMSVASTRLQALQTRQQLGVQSLSIANQDSQLILRLFGL